MIAKDKRPVLKKQLNHCAQYTNNYRPSQRNFAHRISVAPFGKSTLVLIQVATNSVKKRRND